MKIGILQTGQSPEPLREGFGDYPDMFVQMLAGQGFDFVIYRALQGDIPASPTDCDGWLITGSRFGVYEDHPWIPPLEQFIRAVYQARVPMVGVCFGHQIIAQAMGGRVEKFAQGWAVGPTDYDFGGETLTLNAWHQDQVVQKPTMARVLARNAFCENAALLYDDSILTVQAHPEFGAGFLNGLIDMRGKGVVPDDQLSKAREDSRHVALDTQVMAARIAAFLKAKAGRNSAKAASTAQ